MAYQTIQASLRDLGTLRIEFAKMLEKMWEKRSLSCTNKRKPTFDHWHGDPMCKEIKNLDHPGHEYRCCYNNCPYT